MIHLFEFQVQSDYLPANEWCRLKITQYLSNLRFVRIQLISPFTFQSEICCLPETRVSSAVSTSYKLSHLLVVSNNARSASSFVSKLSISSPDLSIRNQVPTIFRTSIIRHQPVPQACSNRLHHPRFAPSPDDCGQPGCLPLSPSLAAGQTDTGFDQLRSLRSLACNIPGYPACAFEVRGTPRVSHAPSLPSAPRTTVLHTRNAFQLLECEH